MGVPCKRLGTRDEYHRLSIVRYHEGKLSIDRNLRLESQLDDARLCESIVCWIPFISMKRCVSCKAIRGAEWGHEQEYQERDGSRESIEETREIQNAHAAKIFCAPSLAL